MTTFAVYRRADNGGPLVPEGLNLRLKRAREKPADKRAYRRCNTIEDARAVLRDLVDDGFFASYIRTTV